MSAVVVGVDIGTSTVKALALDGDGRVLGSAQRPTRWSRGADGRTATSAASIVGDVLATVGGAIASAEAVAGGVTVAAVGLAGLGESGFLLDPQGSPVAPAIAWYDTRGAEQMAALDPGLALRFPATTGLKVGPQCTVAKLLWMRDTGVTVRPGSCWLNVPEYVAHALGADRVTEPSLASRTGLLDQATGTAWADLLEVAHLPADVLPSLVPAGQPIGVVTAADAPYQLRGAVITLAGHDHCAAAVGAGAVEPHELFNSYGTADVFLRSVDGTLTDAMRADLVAYGVDAGRHALTGRSALITGLRGGLLLQRALDELGATGAADREALDRSLPTEIAGLATGSAAVEMAVDGSLRITRSPGATRTDVWQAALAHATVEAARRVDAIDRLVGPHSAAVAAGGWTAMRSVRAARQRAVPGLEFSDVAEPGATGAALFARHAADGAPGELDPTSAVPVRGRAARTPVPVPPRPHKETVHG